MQEPVPRCAHSAHAPHPTPQAAGGICIPSPASRPAGPTPAVSGEHGGVLTAGSRGGVRVPPDPRDNRHSYTVSPLRDPSAPAKGAGCWVSLGALGPCTGPGRGLAGLPPTPGQDLTVNRGGTSPHGSCAAPAAGNSLWPRLWRCGQCQAGLRCEETDGVVWAGRFHLGHRGAAGGLGAWRPILSRCLSAGGILRARLSRAPTEPV